MEIASQIGKRLSDSTDDILDEWFNSTDSKLQELHKAVFAYYDIVLSEILARIEIRVQSLMQNSLIAVRVSLLLSKIAMKATHLVPRITEILLSQKWFLNTFIKSSSSALECELYLIALRRLYSTGCIDSTLRSAVSIEAVLSMLNTNLGGTLLQQDQKLSNDTELSILFHATTFLQSFLNIPQETGITDRICAYGHITDSAEKSEVTAFIGQLIASDIESQVFDSTLTDEVEYSGHSIINTKVQELNELCREIYRSSSSQPITVIPGMSTVLYCGFAIPMQVDPHHISGQVFTDTSRENMKRFLQAILLSKAVVLQGNIGCGKSFIIRELAIIMGQETKLVELHISSQTDSKALVGSYVCSDVPGEFVWQAGILTQAVIHGHWLVIEDVDKAPLDFISAISTLLEHRQLTLPLSNQVIDAHPAFRIIGTRILDDSGATEESSYIPSLRYFSHLFTFVTINECTTAEVECIVTQRYPALPANIRQKLLNVYTFLKFNKSEKHSQMDSDSLIDSVPVDYSPMMNISMFSLKQLRKFTLREVVKVASRIARYANEFNTVSGFLTNENKRKTLQEVLDVFVASIRDNSLAETITQLVAKLWEVDCVDGVVPLLDVYNMPGDLNKRMEGGDGYIKIGRVLLPFSGSTLNDASMQQRFATTKQSMLTLEKIAACVALNEPVLLVGETGTGKTTAVQELAEMLGKKLIVQNLSLSTDVSDLMGGYRPVTIRQHILPLYETFVRLFQVTLSSSQNSDYLQVVAQILAKKSWKKLLEAFLKAADNAIKKLDAAIVKLASEASLKNGTNKSSYSDLKVSWQDFRHAVIRLQLNLPKISEGFAFSFSDGLLVEAMKHGHWVLLDEINLASSETLQGLSSVLDTAQEHYFQSEKGGSDAGTLSIKKHKDFRVFAAMNPPTDIGKRELPLSLRGRFTEFYVDDLLDKQDLLMVTEKYLSNLTQDGDLMDSVVEVYLQCRELAFKSLVDGAGLRPHYSLRSLTRSMQCALSYVSIGIRPLSRTLFEAFRLNFSALLSSAPQQQLSSFLKKVFCPKDSQKELDAPPHRPGGRQSPASDWVLIKPFWIRAGREKPVDLASESDGCKLSFVITPTVAANLRNIVAAIAANVAPILLQGPTSVGKTSMIEYLAAKSGNKCVRINNHEHTDVQEYIGGYITNSSGQLEFKDGLLLEAMRSGYWIILDELNLAPSDVLEALNRLLDDNKELFVAETGEFVKPSAGFLLFATQNPPGVYGGRKPLSRAFKNRFVEINVSDLPLPEVETIICNSCGIAPKFANMLVQTMHQLQMRRQKSSLFQGKYGAITTRDLIKWGRRELYSLDDVVREGYMLIAERARSVHEREEILCVLNEECKTIFAASALYKNPIDFAAVKDSKPSKAQVQSQPLYEMKRYEYADLLDAQQKLQAGELIVEGVNGIVLTENFQRMWTLVGRCITYNEPGLLIGETGCGKTAVCQLIAAYRGQRIRVLNCHQSIETADIIGSLRPIRGRESIKMGWLQSFKALLFDFIATFEQDWSRDDNFSSARLVFDQLESSMDVKDDLSSFKEHTLKIALDEVMQFLNRRKEAAANQTLTSGAVDEESSRKKKKNKTSSQPPAAKTGVETEEDSKVRALLHLCENAQLQWVRLKSLFEWQDGPLVTAMKEGDIFLMDEINLAEDAVIERLNSVLESGRAITLAEKGGQVSERLVAHPNFKFLATMNPAGDFGKRELSPALRSRFTEMWIPSHESDEDVVRIISEILQHSAGYKIWADSVATSMLRFLNWFNDRANDDAIGKQVRVTTREILAWTNFICQCEAKDEVEIFASFIHGAHMIILDGLGMGMAISTNKLTILKQECFQNLLSLCPNYVTSAFTDGGFTFLESPTSFRVHPSLISGRFSIGSFSIPCIQDDTVSADVNAFRSRQYVLDSRNSLFNLGRILRAMQSPRPILLEGAPGVGKSSLITQLANLTGHTLTRINLSEHSELTDLLGCDLPATGDSEETLTQFRWYDGCFLRAMKEGHWVLLDELNLAPQAVLEGLNSCLDHRQEIFLPEIGQVVHCHPSFKVFSAQNPVGGGGGRKGLPQSFLSRFSRVYMVDLTSEDYLEIVSKAFEGADLTEAWIDRLPEMVQLIALLKENVVEKGLFAHSGSPWEFNLRDIFRWCQLLMQPHHSPCERGLTVNEKIMSAASMLFVDRFRTISDRRSMEAICLETIHGSLSNVDQLPKLQLRCDGLYVGSAYLTAQDTPSYLVNSSNIHVNAGNSLMMVSNNKLLQSLMQCVAMKWPVHLVGPAGSGKRRTLQNLANLTGRRLVYFCASPSTDCSELLGSFEQKSAMNHIWRCLGCIEEFIMPHLRTLLTTHTPSSQVVEAMGCYRRVASLAQAKSTSPSSHGGDALSRDDENELRSSLQALLEFCWEEILREGDEEGEIVLKVARAELQKVFDISTSSQSTSSFEWQDGIVLKAMQRGHWLAVSHSNLCPASVLDRLNSLLEPDGSLLLTEGGETRNIRPHSDFRVFFLSDPSLGEMSRAMRNRCVEISVTIDTTCQNAAEIADSVRYGLPLSQTIHSLLKEFKNFVAESGRLGSSLSPRRKIVNRILEVAQLRQLIGQSVRSPVSGTQLPQDSVAPEVKNSINSIISTSFRLSSFQFMSIDTLMALNQTAVLRDTSYYVEYGVPFLASILCERLLAGNSVSNNQDLTTMGFSIVNPSHDDFDLQNMLRNIAVVDIRRYAMSLMAGTTSRESAFVRCTILKLLSPINSADEYEFFYLQFQKSIVHKYFLTSTGCDLTEKALLRLLDIVFYRRSEILWSEHTAIKSVSTLNMNTIQSSSMYVLAYALCSDMLASNNLEFSVLRDMYKIIRATDSLLEKFHSGVTCDPNCFLSKAKIDCVEDLYFRRDVFVRMMIEKGTNMSNNNNNGVRFFRWEEVTVCVRWIEKSAAKLMDSCSHDEIRLRDFNLDFQKVYAAFKAVLSGFNSLVRHYWSLPPLSGKIRLWKEGGHGLVPATASQWKALISLRQVLDLKTYSIPAGREGSSLPSFIVTLARKNSIESTNPLRRLGASGYRLFKDWLCLYTTFNWACNRLVSESGKAGDKSKILTEVEMNSLTSSMTSKFDEFVSKSGMNNEEVEFTKNEQCMGVCMVMEMLVLRTTQVLTNSLAKIIRTFESGPSFRVDIPFISNLAMQVQSMINFSIRYTLFDVSKLRDFQSVFWQLEAFQNDHEECHGEEFIANIRSLLTSIDGHLCNMLHYNLASHPMLNIYTYACGDLYEVHTAFQSKTRMMIDTEINLGDKHAISTADNLFFQGTIVQVALKYIDARVLFPRVVDCHALGCVLLRDTAELNLLTYGMARLQLSELFCAVVAEGNVTSDEHRQVSSTSSFSRLDLVLLYSLDILTSCRDIYTRESPILPVVKTLRHQTEPIWNIFAVLSNLEVSKWISLSSSNIQRLFKLCLEPMFSILSDEALHVSPYDHITAIGKCWALIGVVRATLLLPNLPVDPAARPKVKCRMYEQRTDIWKHSLQVQVIHRSMTYQYLLDENMVTTCQDIERAKKIVDRISRKAVERPSTASDFREVFVEIVSAVQTLADVDRITQLLDNVDEDSAIEMKVLEEINLQGSLLSCIQRLQQNYSEYEDIVAPIVSALGNISSGLRLLIGHVHSNGGQSKKMLSCSNFWVELLTFPQFLFSSLESYGSAVDSVFRSSLFLLQSCDSLCSTTAISMGEAKALNAVHFSYLNPEKLRSVSSHIVSLLTLCRIDNCLSTKTIPCDKMYESFHATIIKLVQIYIARDEEKKVQTAQKAALFKYKTQTSTFKSDEVEEIDADLLKNFPAHLKDLEKKIATDEEAAEEIMQDADSDDENHPNQLNSSESLGTDSENEPEILFFDESCEFLVELHCRMIFVFRQDLLEEQSAVWNAFSKRFRSDMISSNENRMQQRMSEYTLLASKVFECSLSDLYSVNLNSRLRGGLLMALSTVMNSYAVEKDNATLAGKGDRVVDRDLLSLFGANPNSSSDFHLDSDLGEAAKATSCLEKLMSRTRQLLQQFPGNELLEQVYKVAAGISSFHISSSIGKLLAGLQLLLKKAQDWEAYASRHVSLQVEMADLKRLIVRWRDQELASWERLLRCKEIECNKKAMTVWFPLARIFSALPLHLPTSSKIEGPSQNGDMSLLEVAPSSWLSKEDSSNAFVASTEASMSDADYLGNVFRILDGMLRSSTIGEFPTKLHLLRLFSLQLLQEANTSAHEKKNDDGSSTSSSCKQEVGNLTYGIWRYYEQFLQIVRNFQDLLRAPIQQAVEGEAKLGHWDQLSVYALVEHSEKVHRRLNKRIRAYQNEVLVVPISVLLRREVMGGLVNESGELISSTQMPSLDALFPAIKNTDAELFSVTQSIEPHCIVTEINQTLTHKLIESDSIEDLSFLGSFGADFPRLTKLKSLCKKAVKYLTEALVPEVTTQVEPAELEFSIAHGYGIFGYRATVIAETLCDTIFSRLKYLQELTIPSKEEGEEKSSKIKSSAGVLKSVKLRAVSELFSTLTSQGISHLRSNVPAQLRDNTFLLSAHHPIAIEILGDLEFSSFSPRDVFEKGEMYHFKNMVEVAQLRVHVSSSVSKDLSQRDTIRMMGFAENMFSESFKLRSSISAAMDNHRALNIQCQALSDLSARLHSFQMGIKPAQDSDELIGLARILLQMFLQMQQLLHSAGDAVAIHSKALDPLLAIHMSKDDRTPQEVMKSIISDLSAFTDIRGSTTEDRTISAECVSSWQCKSPSSAQTKDINEGLVSIPQKFWQIYPDLVRLLSHDVVDPMGLRVEEFARAVTQPQSIEEVGDGDGFRKEIEKMFNVATRCVDDCLISVQNIRAMANVELPASVPVDGDEGGITLTECLNRSMSSLNDLRVSLLCNELSGLCKFLPHPSCHTDECPIKVEDIGITLRSMQHLVGSVLNAHAVLLSGLLRGYKSTSKLCYICCRLFRNLVCKGLCSPPTREDGDEDKDDNGNGAEGQQMNHFEDNCEGTGMGEGEGLKDVSDQIENEEQLLGTKQPPSSSKDDDAQAKNKNEKKEKPLSKEEADKGVEMMQDFEGDMMDLEQDDEDNNSNEDEEEENPEEPDKEMGDADMKDIVDEKQWDDDDDLSKDKDGPQDTQKEKFERDSKMKGDTIDGEMTTKDDDDREKNQEKDKDDEDDKNNGEKGAEPPSEEEEPGEESNREEDGKINEDLEDNYMDKVHTNSNRKDDEKDLDSDVEGPEGAGEEDGAEQEQGECADEDLPDNMEIDGQGQDQDQDQDQEGGEEEVDIQDEGTEGKGDEENEEENSDANQDEKSMDEADNNREAQLLGQAGNAEEPQNEPADLTSPATQSQPQLQRQQTFGVASVAGKESILDHADSQQQEGEQHGQQQESNGVGEQQDRDGEAGGGTKGSGQGESSSSGENKAQPNQNPAGADDKLPPRPPPYREPPNPLRDSGDIQRSWHRRLDVRDNDTESAEDNEQPNQQSEGKGQFEYIQKKPESAEADKNSGDQVLANVEKEEDAMQLNNNQHQNNDDMGAGDDQEDDGQDVKNDERELENAPKRTEKVDGKSPRPKRDRTEDNTDNQVNESKRKIQKSEATETADDDSQHMNEDPEDVDPPSLDEELAEETKSMSVGNPSQRIYTHASFRLGEQQEKIDLSIAEEELHTGEEFDDKLDQLQEVVMLNHSSRGKNKEDLMRIKAETHGYAVQLSEQLRLILTPTLCTRLQGDYRTGKRINMRKLISYVASGFRRDKIWMRRTKPAKREYQVMLMIDDSSSMGAAGPLALSALCTISGALSHLDLANDSLCIASFAEDTKILHSFGSPLTDEKELQVLSSFTFAARRTMLASSLQTVMPIFEHAKASLSGGSREESIALQICFVVSDARIDSDNRGHLARIIRSLFEKNILVVLLIIDRNADKKDSIFRTRTVTFTGDRVQTACYLEDFPFPYYLAIEELHTLPEILSDALKQWFELIRGQQHSET